jgi:hypothetical protein
MHNRANTSVSVEGAARRAAWIKLAEMIASYPECVLVNATIFDGEEA